MTPKSTILTVFAAMFQYRKRYEVTCDFVKVDGKIVCMRFQYRKRYEVTCDGKEFGRSIEEIHRFNTASGMRPHVTLVLEVFEVSVFQVSIPQAV